MTRFGVYYTGLDIHKKTIRFCTKHADGTIVDEGTIQASWDSLRNWAESLEHPWCGAMEATIFSDWVYDCLFSYPVDLKVGNTSRLKAIAEANHKSDKLDARTLADLLRCDYFPSCYMAPAWMRELKRILRYRNYLVRESVRFMNRNAGLLMQTGATYTKGRLHQKAYFEEILTTLDETPSSVKRLLKMGYSQIGVLDALQRDLVRGLVKHPRLRDRILLLQTIPGVGDITSLTWVLEVGEPQRFTSVRKAVSYSGLCPGQKESGGKVYKQNISKQRNPHLQSILIEAAKLAPRYNADLKAHHQRQLEKKKSANIATLEVARKMVSYLMAVDREKRPFETRAV